MQPGLHRLVGRSDVSLSWPHLAGSSTRPGGNSPPSSCRRSRCHQTDFSPRLSCFLGAQTPLQADRYLGSFLHYGISWTNVLYILQNDDRSGLWGPNVIWRMRQSTHDDVNITAPNLTYGPTSPTIPFTREEWRIPGCCQKRQFKQKDNFRKDVMRGCDPTGDPSFPKMSVWILDHLKKHVLKEQIKYRAEGDKLPQHGATGAGSPSPPTLQGPCRPRRQSTSIHHVAAPARMGCVQSRATEEGPPVASAEPEGPPPTDPRLPLTARQVFSISKSWKGIVRAMESTGVTMFIRNFSLLKLEFVNENVNEPTTFRWFSRFKNGMESVKDEKRVGRPILHRNPEKVSQISNLITRH
ncbi:Globin [Cordylochernes scorpioides]|uniref:Globin n=1 Tax=Cordylochernes scorpioides TaxID=51811 RepID=A0ABY6LFZ3_9ARAC|nr:Globin [Cordylochernes scorpioides]